MMSAILWYILVFCVYCMWVYACYKAGHFLTGVFIALVTPVEAASVIVADDTEFWIHVRVVGTLTVMFGVIFAARWLYTFVISCFSSVMGRLDRIDQAFMQTNVKVQELSVDLSKTSAAVGRVAIQAEPVVAKVNSGMTRACDAYDSYVLCTVIIACIAMSRNLYARWTKKDGENKEAKMSEKDVFVAFDTFAVLCFVPLFVKDGFGAATRVWQSIRSLGVMVRTLCDGISLFSGWVGSSDEKSPDAFTGIGFVNDLAKTTDEVVARVEEKHISKSFVSGGFHNVPPPKVCGLCDKEWPNGCVCKIRQVDTPRPDSPILPLSPVQTMLEEKEIYPNDVKQAKTVEVPVARPVNVSVSSRTDPEVMWSGLRKIWDGQENAVRFAQLQTQVETHPWVLPLIMFILFATLLMLVRWMRKSEENKEGWFTVAQKTIPGVPAGCCHSQYHVDDGTGRHCPLKDKKPTINSDLCCSTYCGGKWCIHWAGCSGHVAPTYINIEEVKSAAQDCTRCGMPGCGVDCPCSKEVKERKKSPAKTGSRKPWVDYDGVSDDNTYFQDDSGSIYRRLTKRERLAAEEQDRYQFEHPMDRSANADVPLWGVVKGDTQEGKKKFIQMASERGFKKVAAADVKESATIVRMPTKLVPFVKCTGKFDCVCGRFHSKPNVEKKMKKDLDKKDLSKVQCRHCQQFGHFDGKFTGGTRGANGKWSGGTWVKTCTAEPVPKDVQEAAINGARFPESGVVMESVGWAESGSNALCFTASLNGLAVSKHLFKGSEAVTFYHAKFSPYVTDMSKGKLIANDQLLFPVPSEWKGLKQLGSAICRPGDKVKMCCFDSREQALSGKGWSDQGVVKNIVDTEGLERAACSYSSDFGNCSGPVINTLGKCVGWHNATTKVETAFIPVTTLVVAKATGSVSSF